MTIVSGKVLGKVKGGRVLRVKLRGSEMYGEVVSKEERFDLRESKIYPVTFFKVKLENGNEVEFTRNELKFL